MSAKGGSEPGLNHKASLAFKATKIITRKVPITIYIILIKKK